MRTVLLASLRTHTRRFVAAAVAVVIGVSFIVVTEALSSATRNGLLDGVDVPYRNADLVVSDLGGTEAARLVGSATERGDHAAVLGWTLQPVTQGGRIVDQRADVGTVTSDPLLRWQQLREGRFPRGAGEALADVNAAKSDRIGIGDELRVGSGSRATTVTVVGLADTPSAMVTADLYLPWADLEQWAARFHVESVAYAGSGASVDRFAGETGAKVQTVDAWVEDVHTDITNEVNVIATVLLVFAAIALFVSVLVIANTFTILFAQRARDLALLRCVGGTRRQVLRSIRLEALALGTVASLLGILVGTGLGFGLIAVAHQVLPPHQMGSPTVSPGWYAAAFALGLVVTLVAAWLPSRRVVRMSPLAALRPDTGVDVRSASGRVRTGSGLAMVVVGAATLAASIATHSAAVMVAGGAMTFTGVLLLGPLLVPSLIRVAGRAAGRLIGPAGRLAAGNAVRNPRRTAATTSSLLVGVTLTTAVLTGLASSRSAVAEDQDVSHPIDMVLTSSDAGLPASVLAEVRAVPGVADAAALDGTTAQVDAGVGRVQLVAPGPVSGIVHGTPTFTPPQPGEVYLPADLLPEDDRRRVTVTVDGRSTRLRAIAGEGWGSAAVVAPATLAALTDRPDVRAVWVRAADAADPEDLSGDLSALGHDVGAELHDGLVERAWVERQLDVLTGAVVALLGIAVVIALIGIGNTLGLSVLERARENALLRALGVTRRQIRRMLAVEAVLLSVVATVLGSLIGIVFAWVAVEALVRPAVDHAPLLLPWGQIGLVVLVSGAAGLLACLLPARRASRVTPAAGLALE